MGNRSLNLRLSEKSDTFWERFFPERKVYLRSENDTRFFRVRSTTQAVGFFSSALLLAWTILATAIFLMDSLGAGSFRDQAILDQQSYQNRLREISDERDLRSGETKTAHRQFDLALREVAGMQSQLLELEVRRR